MASFYEKLYFSSSPFFQNFFVSMYGLMIRRRRYGGNAKEYTEQLRKSEHFSQNQMEDLQNQLFQKFVKHAFDSVPFYMEWSRRTGLKSRDIASLSDIQKLPIISREMLRQDPYQFCSIEYLARKDVFWLYTSGTSGKPIRILCDQESRRRHYAFWVRLREWFGIKPGQWRATFFGRVIAKPEASKPPFWRTDFPGRNVMFSSYHLSHKNICHYLRKLRTMQPVEIIGYPSSLYRIARYLQQTSQCHIKPQCVFTTAETLLPYQREAIEDVFGCNVIDQYGCTEMALFVSQCTDGFYINHSEHSYIELINSNGGAVPIGDEGEVVCTSFVNMAMPLLRYRLGDILSFSSRRSSNNRAFQPIKNILGRIDDVIITPDGRHVGRLDPVFKGLDGISEAQIIQSHFDKIDVFLCPSDTFSERTQYVLQYELKKRLGDFIKISFHIVDEIQKDNNGKFRFVISNLNSGTRNIT